MKTTTIRLPESLFHQLEAVAAVQQKSVSEVIRGASEELVTRCSADKGFRTDLVRTVKDLAAKPAILANAFGIDSSELSPT